MLPIIICLLPLVASVPTLPRRTSKTFSENQIVIIENGTLKNVQIIDFNHTKLNLSDFPGLCALEKNAFNDVLDINTLLLAKNSFTSLPDFVFSNLTKLEKLSLSDNQISSVRNLFVGLENLQLLDISRNPVRHLRRGDLFGLTKSVKILTEGNIFWSISTGVFTNSFLKDAEERLDLENTSEEIEEVDADTERDAELPVRYQEEKMVSKGTGVKMCRCDNIVTSLEILQKDETLPEGCIQVPVDFEKKLMNLDKQNIKSFKKGWYQLQSLPIAMLYLSYNNITEITEETLNDLPIDLTYVNFRWNKIRKIRTIENDHLRNLHFGYNLIEEIEEDAFEKTKLRGLYLSSNRLQNLNFVHNLPETLTELVVNENRVTSIPDGAFSKLSHLKFLNLEDNKIETLQNDVFHGLVSLQALMLKGNSISMIEPSAFKGLTALKVLDLHHNSVRNLQEGTFVELTALEELNLANNKIAKATFGVLPQSVCSLHLDDNEIEVLEEGDFVQAPRCILSLTGNRISTIKRGAFNLPALKDLYLSNNTLTTIDGDSYEGLGRLRRLWLSENKISEIHKGACKNLGSLYVLNISRNPFQKLENGALYGLNTAFGTSLYIYENNLKEIQGGVFDNV